MSKKIYLVLLFISSFSSAYECKYLDIFQDAAQKYNLDYRLLCSIGNVESNYNPYALNIRKNDYDIGVMQINSWWFKKLKKVGMDDPRMLFDYTYNINVGAWILKDCIKSFGISKKAIDCYNKGSSKANKNSDYVGKIITQYNYFTRKYKRKKEADRSK